MKATQKKKLLTRVNILDDSIRMPPRRRTEANDTIEFLKNNRRDKELIEYIARYLVFNNPAISALTKPDKTRGGKLKDQKILLSRVLTFLKRPNKNEERLLSAIQEVIDILPSQEDREETFAEMLSQPIQSAKALNISNIPLSKDYGLEWGDICLYAYLPKEQAFCSSSYAYIKIGMSLNMYERLYNIYSYFPRGVHLVALLFVGNASFGDTDPRMTTRKMSAEDEAMKKRVMKLERQMLNAVKRGYILYDPKKEEFDDIEVIPLKTPARKAWNGEWTISKYDDIVKLFEEVGKVEKLKVKSFERPLKNEKHFFGDTNTFGLSSLCPHPTKDFDLETGKQISIANTEIDDGVRGKRPLIEYLREIGADRRLSAY